MGDCRPRRDGVAGPCEEGVVLREHPVDLAVELDDAESGIGGVCRYQTGEGRGGGYLRAGRERERRSAPPSAIDRTAAGGGRKRESHSCALSDTGTESAALPAGMALASTASRLPARASQ